MPAVTVNGRLQSAGDVDSFAVELHEGQKVRITTIGRTLGSSVCAAVRVLGPDGREVARGITAYTAAETLAILGCPCSEIERRLGYSGPDELIHRDDLVLM